MTNAPMAAVEPTPLDPDVAPNHHATFGTGAPHDDIGHQPQLASQHHHQDPHSVSQAAAAQAAAEAVVAAAEVAVQEGQPPDENLIYGQPNENDVLNGRGASVNSHRGNQKFRALCFSRKAEFDAGNHAVKRRIAVEIVNITLALPARFLQRRGVGDKAPWFLLTHEKAVLKACQVMRDFRRPDRVAAREQLAAQGAKKRQRTTESTPGVDTSAPIAALAPIVENPFGVHDHDVLSGRGAFVNGHIGNARFRQLALDRKPQFDAGNYSEKRALATEIVACVKDLHPPGRFLKRVAENGTIAKSAETSWNWEELSDEQAIHKACQVMRDIQREDRIDGRRSRGGKRKQIQEAAFRQAAQQHQRVHHDHLALAESAVAATTVEEATVAATEEILDKTFDSTGGKQEAKVPLETSHLG